MENLTPKKILRTTYVTSALFTLQLALLAFVSSSFLEQYISIQSVGLVFTAGSIVTILLLVCMPKLLKRFGNFTVISVSLAGSIVSLIALSTLNQTIPIIFFFILHMALTGTIALNFDIYVEEFSSRDSIGSIRGLFLTFSNAAWIIGQLLIAIILTDNDYWKVFFFASFFALAAFVWSHRFRHVPDIHYKAVPLRESVETAWRRWNVRHILASSLLLQFFFGWMTIYTPIYLHEKIGLGWGELGIIFTIMLLPYVLFELPLGRIADKRLGEKELLMAGFVTAGVTKNMLRLVTNVSISSLGLLLFLTRVGSSCIEVMNETYFFKKVKADDATLMDLFRITRPVGYVVAPIVASICLLFLPQRYLFIPLGLFMIGGV